MATPQQLQALADVYGQAKVSEHIYPAMAACEAMVETGWMASELARDYCNLFGQKQSVEAPIFLSVSMPTWEVVNGQKIDIRAKFVWFPNAAACFTVRMHTLLRLSDQYPNYATALHASNAEDYVTAVSRTWSTDRTRAAQCIAIYHAHANLFDPVVNIA